MLAYQSVTYIFEEYTAPLAMVLDAFCASRTQHGLFFFRANMRLAHP